MTIPASKQTLSQRRAAHAWQVVEHIKKDLNTLSAGQPRPTDRGKKLAGQMKKLPVRIISAGLGQALAFLRAKDEAPLLEQALADWLLSKRAQSQHQAFEPRDDAGQRLLDTLVNQWSAQDLRRHTEEALAYLPWLIRFAEAEGLMKGAE